MNKYMAHSFNVPPVNFWMFFSEFKSEFIDSLTYNFYLFNISVENNRV